MKLNPNANIPRFLQAVYDCNGDVFFTTPDGDNLNLKSALSQFVFAAVIAGQLKDLSGDIHLNDQQDLPILEAYLLQ